MTTEGNNITLITTHIQREKDINKCIVKKKNVPKRQVAQRMVDKIEDASVKMNDSLLINLNDSEQNQIRYHSRERYKPYILKAERFHVITTHNDTPTNDTTIEDDEALPKRSKRRKSYDSDICHQKKSRTMRNVIVYAKLKEQISFSMAMLFD